MSDLKFVLEHTMLNENDIIALVLPTGERVWKGMVKDAYPLSESYSFNRFIKQEQINEKFNKPTEVLEVSKLKKEEKPVKGTYSLGSKDEVLKAIKFFNYQKPDKEEDYANAIINKMHKYGISSDKIGADNRLCKYVDSCTADLSEEVLNEKKFEDVSKMSDEEKRAEIDRLKKVMDTADDDKYPSLVYASTEKRIQKLEGSLQEHLSGNMTAEDIAKKHDVDVETINKQLEMGIKVEHEHTKDDGEAKRIALDHLYEIPDYYTRLDKMEEEGEKALDESKIQGEHKCPNCGATLDAWDGTFCDAKCKEEYENRNKPQEDKKETTNEELLTEKPLYVVGDEEKPENEIKSKGKSINTEKEVSELKKSGDVMFSKKHGACNFAPDGSLIDGKGKAHDAKLVRKQYTQTYNMNRSVYKDDGTPKKK